MTHRSLVAVVCLGGFAGCSGGEPPTAAKPPVAAVANSDDAKAEAGPRHKAVIAIHNGKPGESTSCAATNYQGDGLIHASGAMSCGHPGKVSELKWKFSGRRGDQDVYAFTRTYPLDAPNAAMTTKEVGFSGGRVVVFEDVHQTILMDAVRD